MDAPMSFYPPQSAPFPGRSDSPLDSANEAFNKGVADMGYETWDDKQLWIATQAGQVNAFNVLIKRFDGFAFNYIRRIAGGSLDESRCRDITQIVWLSILVWIQKPEKPFHDNFKAFLVISLRRAFVSVLRKLNRQGARIGSASDDGCPTEFADLSPDATSKSGSSDEFEWAIEGLPELLVSIVRLTFVEGLTLAEVAARVGRSTGYVCKLQQKAEELIREKYLRRKLE